MVELIITTKAQVYKVIRPRMQEKKGQRFIGKHNEWNDRKVRAKTGRENGNEKEAKTFKKATSVLH